MARKKGARRSEEEKRIHNIATKIRKFSDEEIVDAVYGKKTFRKDTNNHKQAENISDLNKLLKCLANGECSGVGIATVRKIEKFVIDKNLY